MLKLEKHLHVHIYLSLSFLKPNASYSATAQSYLLKGLPQI